MAAWPPVNTSTQKEEARDPGAKLAAQISLLLWAPPFRHRLCLRKWSGSPVMAQQGKAPARKSGNLSWIPEIHVKVDAGNQLHRAVFWPPQFVWCHGFMSMCMHTQKLIIKFKKHCGEQSTKISNVSIRPPCVHMHTFAHMYKQIQKGPKPGIATWPVILATQKAEEGRSLEPRNWTAWVT